MPRLRPYVPAAILLFGCALLTYTRSQVAVPLSQPLTTVLSNLRGYQVTEQTVSAEERRIAGMTQYVARAYLRDSALAFTTLVSYYDRQTQGRTIHSPRNCLPGAGWEIVQGGPLTLSVDGGKSRRTVNRYVLRNGTSTAVAYYWYQGRGRVTASEYAVKWNLLRDAALMGHTEEALVRVVVPVLSRSAVDRAATDAADATARDVAARLMQDVERVLPPVGRGV